MDDLSAKLSEILSDKESMKKVKALAEGLLSGDEGGHEEKEAPTGNGFGIDGEDVNKLLSVFAQLKSRKDDNRTALLMALRPNLSPEKQKKLDTAIKLLKLIDLLPLLKDSGILNLF